MRVREPERHAEGSIVKGAGALARIAASSDGDAGRSDAPTMPVRTAPCPHSGATLTPTPVVPARRRRRATTATAGLRAGRGSDRDRRRRRRRSGTATARTRSCRSPPWCTPAGAAPRRRVTGQGEVGVRVGVDEPRRHHQPGDIDDRRRVTAAVARRARPDGGDPIAADRDVGRRGRGGDRRRRSRPPARSSSFDRHPLARPL